MAHEELKARQSVMWGAGSFDEVATDERVEDVPVHHIALGVVLAARVQGRTVSWGRR